MDSISTVLSENEERLKKDLRLDKNFDLISRPLIVGGRRGHLYFINADANNQVLTVVLNYFMELPAEESAKLRSAQDFMERCLPYSEAKIEPSYQKALMTILTGPIVLFLDGFPEAVLIDAKSYPQRETDEPEKDKVIRGSHDGFIEMPLVNAALLRRRIKNPAFCMEKFSVGTKSPADVVICYLEGKADPQFLSKVITHIQAAKVEALTMNQESLLENMIKSPWWNPLPQVRYSERPDLTSASILEGSIVLLMDNSPMAMVLPVKFIDFFIEANDYYFRGLTGTYFRFVRVFTFLVSLLLTPLWLALMEHVPGLPDWLQFITVQDPVGTPLLFQLLLMEFILEIMQTSSANTPNMLGNAFGIVGSLLVGDFAVSSGWVCSEAVFYTAFLSISTYTQPSFELGYAVKFLRIGLLLLSHFLGLYGFFGGLALVVLLLTTTKTLSGQPYFYPILPFSWVGIAHSLTRTRLHR